ncbi:MAG: hypothetical protein K5886_08785, partial [Lachnospiraceae bacterium]|nr:hypothetical protein [Lachnospiraceae bacterium]
FRHKDVIKFSEVDEDKKLGIKGILNYFQDVSELQSESLGTGYLKLDTHNYGWILNSWQIQIRRRPLLGETIYSATSPHKLKGIEGDRNFFIFGENDEVLVNANSIWSFYDRNKKTLMKIPEAEKNAFELFEPYPMEYEPRRINIRNIPADAFVYDDTVKVRYSMIDVNSHMNNSCYAIIANDHLPRDHRYDQIRVEYAKMALLDDRVIIKHYEDPERYIIKLENEKEEIFAICEFRYLGLSDPQDQTTE